MIKAKLLDHKSKNSIKYKIFAFLAITLLLSYIIVSINGVQGKNQSSAVKTSERIIDLKIKEMKAYYFDKFNFPIKESNIKNVTDRDKHEPAVYMNKIDGNNEAWLPNGFMMKDDACFIADTAAFRVIHTYPGKLYRQIATDESVMIIDVWVNEPTDYYILGYSNGLQIYHCDGRQFQKLDAAFSGLENSKYVKAYFCDGKVVITEQNNNIYYYDLKNIHNKIDTLWDLSFGKGYLKNTLTMKRYKADLFDSSILYPLGKDKNNNIYIVCNKENAEVKEQFLLKLDIQKESAEVMKIDYNPLSCNDLRLKEDGSLYQMVFVNKTFTVKELRFMDTENSSANISDKVNGTIKDLPMNQDLLYISFIDTQTGYMSIAQCYNHNYDTTEYKLLKTIDGGNTWNNVYKGIEFCCLKFATESKGFGFNNEGKMYMTVDGGCNWEPANFNNIKNISQIDVLDEKTMFAVSNGLLYRTTDGGISWKSIHLPEKAIDSYHISWISKKEGYLLYTLGGGCGFEAKKLYYTADEGKNWTLKAKAIPQDDENRVSNLEAGGYISGICFFPDGTGYLSTSRGYTSKTADMGITFTPLKLPGDFDMPNTLDFINKKDGYLITGYSYSNQLYRTFDGGNSWKQVWPLNLKVGAVAFSSASQGIGVIYFPGDGSYVSSTSDGGKTWTKLNNIKDGCIRQIDIGEDGTFWMLKENQSESGYSSTLLRSRDKGYTWDTVKKLNSMSGTFSLINSTTVYLGNHCNEMYKTTDGGDTWTGIPQEEKTWNTSFAEEDCGWGLAKGGILVNTSNGGQTWKPKSFGGIMNISDIKLIDKNNYNLISHKDGKYSILHSQDGGQNFKQIIFQQGSFDYLYFVDSKNMFGVNNGMLFRSTDGGIAFESVR